MQHVNLYQEQFRRRRDPLDAHHLLLWLVVVAAGLALVSGGMAWRLQEDQARFDRLEGRKAAASDRLDELRTRLADARAAAGPDAAVARLRAELAAKRRLLDYLRSGPLARRGGFSPYLRGLARRKIDGLWLKRIELDDGGSRLRLDGHAANPDRIPQLIDRLGQEDAYAGQVFRTLDIERPKDASGRVDFVLASRRLDDGRKASGQ